MAAAYSPCAGSSPSAGGIFSGSLRDGVRVRVRVWLGVRVKVAAAYRLDAREQCEARGGAQRRYLG